MRIAKEKTRRLLDALTVHVTDEFEMSGWGRNQWHLEVKLEQSDDRPWWMRQAFRLCTTKTRGPRATTFVALLCSYIGGYDRGLKSARDETGEHTQ